MREHATPEPTVIRLEELVAMALIGDAVLGLLTPKQHVRRWLVGPASWRRLAASLADRPAVTRGFALAELVAATWWASRLPAPGRPPGG